jgi:hypothetical protein
MAGDETKYIPNGGQTAVPPTSNINVPRMAFTPTPRPNPPLPPFEFRTKWKQEGWSIFWDTQHELHGVSPHMIDWFWANMEKCYFLWAPGDHKWFEWIVPPSKVGLVGSALRAYEHAYPGSPVLGPLSVERKDMSWYPFTTALSHVILEYRPPEWLFAVIHQWETADYGSLHRMTGIAKGGILSASHYEDSKVDHPEYEEARWCDFLPQLYHLWKDHPDPSQNVQFDLRVKKLPDGEWAYVSENKPPIK